MMKKIDAFLNNITMYRVVLYGLLVIAFWAVIFGFTGELPFTGFQLLLSLSVSVTLCMFSNWIFSKVFHAVTNVESSIITALILFFILPPITTKQEAIALSLAAVIAMASKYILAIKKKHIFNPAAVAALIVGYLLNAGATWWVGSFVLLPSTLIVGLLIIRKIRRPHLLLSFILSSVTTVLFFSWLSGYNLPDVFMQMMTSWPLIFFGTVMLTEPLTTPPTKSLQTLYGTLVGFLFGLPLHIGFIYMAPELALLLGNIFSYIVSPKQKLLLRLKEKIEQAPMLYDFVFTPDQQLSYLPGQYLEWTLPHETIDDRGNRRYFTIASSPTEPEIRLGVKIPTNPSTFKKTLLEMKKNDVMFASQLAGDFTLPAETHKKLVLIAGGIGVTPFRSMIQSLIDRKEKRNVILFYTASNAQEFTYQDIFTTAQRQLGVQTHYVITQADKAPKSWKGLVGRVNADMILQQVPDFVGRMYYLSGPQAMVTSYKEVLHSIGVKDSQIMTDYFPGF
jgi:ferredoxin-NADP reductase/Na+-translocating ferredoxin:NAD+ oxidoreductase RnfD subunit